MSYTIDIDRILGIKPSELIAAIEIRDLKKEAYDAELYIRRATQCFGFGETTLTLDTTYEEFSYEGVWCRKEAGSCIKVMCTADEIFELYKAEYFCNHDVFEKRQEFVQKAKGVSAFRAFVEKCKGLSQAGKTFRSKKF